MPIADGLPHSDFHPEAGEFRQEAGENFSPESVVRPGPPKPRALLSFIFPNKHPRQ